MVRTVSDLVAIFLAWSSRVNASKTTLCYRAHLERFALRFGEMLVGEMKAIHLQEWGKTWHEYQAVQRLFNWAIDDAEVITKNPFRRLRRPPAGQRHRVVSRLESVNLLRNARRPFRKLLLAYRETFARPQEMRLACWEDLHVSDSQVPLVEGLKTGHACIVLWEYKSRRFRRDSEAPRVILLSPRVGRLIARQLERTKKLEGPIFLNAHGRPWSANALRCCMRRLRKRCKLKRDRRGENVVPYSFRHTGATEAAASGVRDRLLAELLGHTNTRTTARYQHLQVEHLRGAMHKLWFFKKGQRKAA